MDSFEKATRKMSAGLVEETSPTNKLYSASKGGMVDFSQPDPLASVPEVPGMQATIDADRKGRKEARSAASQASDAATKAWYGNEDSYKHTPDSLFAKYGVSTDIYRLLDAEKRGLVTLDPKFRADVQGAVGADKRQDAAWDNTRSKDYAAGARVIREDGSEAEHRIVDGQRAYPVRRE